MKKVCAFLLLSGMLSVANAAVPGDLLFNDSFDRADATDISASTTGMSGPLSPLSYNEHFEGSGAASSIQILSNQLNIAVGAGMSSLYVDHNFIDQDILAADGFSVSLDVTGITSADDVTNRFGGFGIGCTESEVMNAEDAFDDDMETLRPDTGSSGAGQGVADFYIDLALDAQVRVWNNGLRLAVLPVDDFTGTISADFVCEDFNAGTTVYVTVYYNGTEIFDTTFQWDNTDSNYIGISGRTAGAGVFLDNLSVATVYDTKATSPIPVDGAPLLDAASLQLSWTKGKTDGGSPDPGITWHYLYIAEDEPNFIGVTPIAVEDSGSAQTTFVPANYNYSFASDNEYYWRVDEAYEDASGSPVNYEDPNLSAGYVWSFDTFTYPVVVADPVRDVVPVSGTATFTCKFSSSSSPESVIWYKEAGDVDTIVDLDLEENDEVTTPIDSVTYTSTLTMADIAFEDEGFYYCIINNSAGPEDSAAAQLVTERLVGYWPLDKVAGEIDLSLKDASVSGNDLTPGLTVEDETYTFPETYTFGTGADGTVDGALEFDGVFALMTVNEDGLVADVPIADESYTVSAWVKPNVADNRGIVSWGNYPNARQVNATRLNNVSTIGHFWWSSDMAATIPDSGTVTDGQWHLVSATYDGTVRTIYYDGIALLSDQPEDHIVQDTSNFFIGKINPVLTYGFDGLIDDVRVYNYALGYLDIAELYVAVTGTSICLGNPEYDFNEDCTVDVKDFAEFAEAWMATGIYTNSDVE